jgi:hypothetical protein
MGHQKRTIMKQGQMIKCVAICIAVLLVTQASVYARHFIAGGGRYSPTNMSQISVKFQFVGVGFRPISDSDPIVPIIDTHIQFTIVIPYEDTSGSISYLRLFTSGTELEPFTVVPEPLPPSSPDRHFITITGKMLSKLLWVVEPDEQHLTEIVDFQVEAVDEKRSDPAGNPLPEFLTLTLHYRETPQLDTADRLLETLGGAGLVTCNAGICTLTLTGMTLEFEIESHTAGGE